MASGVLARVRPRARLLLGAAGCALAAWLWLPSRHAAFERPALRVVLVDVSASVVRPRPDWRRWRDEQLELQARAATARGEELCVVAFADGVERWFGPARAALLDLAALGPAGLGDGASELASALAALGALSGGRPIAHLSLLGDGEFDGAAPAPALQHWLERGARFEGVLVPAPSRCDLALVELRAPRELEAGAPLAVSAVVHSLAAEIPAGARAALELVVRDAAGERRVERALDAERLAAGEMRSVADLGPLAEGLTTVRARVTLAGALDVAPENDGCELAVRSREALVVGVAGAGRPRFRDWLEACQRVAGLDVRELDGRGDAALGDCDVLVTLDLDPRELDAGGVRDFVRRGGGWLAAGGLELLSGLAAAEADGGLAELLPLAVERGPERDLLLLLDGSGSMAGAALEQLREASVELARRAAANERVELSWFTDRRIESFELVAGVAADARAENARRWSSVRPPSGPTDVPNVLRELARRRAGARPALAFLVSDGRDQRARGASAAELESLVADLSRLAVKLVVVAAGEEADREWLDGLARFTERGAAWSASDAELAEVLLSEASHERVARARAAVVVAGETSDDGDARALRAAWSGGRELPGTDAHWRARAKDGDEVLLATGGGDPFLALRRFGAGLCATWTSEPSAEWSGPWIEDLRAIAPLLRTLGRATPSRERFELRARGSPRDGWRLEGCPADWPDVVELSLAERPEERALAYVPHDSNALDPRRTRVAPGLAWRPSARLVARDRGGAELARVEAPSAPAEEFGARRRRFPMHAREAGVPLDAQAGVPGPSRRRAGALALGLGLLAIGWGLAGPNWGPGGPGGQVLPTRRR